ncbi:unnamed protein product [Closterium sp. NIES-53]
MLRSSPRRSPPSSFLSSPPESSRTASTHPITYYYRTARHVVSRVLASLVTDPRASPFSISTLVAPVGDFPGTRRLEYATQMVATRPLAVEGTYVDVVPPAGVNVVDGMWIFKVKRPLGSPHIFKARYVARGFSQRLHIRRDLATPSSWLHWYFPTWDPVEPDVTKSTISARRPMSPTTHYAPLLLTSESDLLRFGFQFSTTRPTPLVVDHRLTGPFPEGLFESSGLYAELVGYLMYLMTCTRPNLVFPLSILSCFVATGKHRPVHWTAAVRVAKYLATT